MCIRDSFAPHVDCGDHVIIINAEKAILTGKKLEKKFYRHHSGWVGGLKEIRYDHLMRENPEKAMMLAVKGMLQMCIRDRHRHEQQPGEHPRLCQRLHGGKPPLRRGCPGLQTGCQGRVRCGDGELHQCRHLCGNLREHIGVPAHQVALDVYKRQDISLLAPLAAALGVSTESLLTADLTENPPQGGNMKNTVLYICPVCGNLIFSASPAGVQCCGRTLEPQKPRKAEEHQRLHTEPVEDEWYITCLLYTSRCV